MVAGIEVADDLLDRCVHAGIQPPRYDRGWDALVALEVCGSLDRIAATFHKLGAMVTIGEMETSLDRLITGTES